VGRLNEVMRLIAIGALTVGVVFLFLPTGTDVPPLALPETAVTAVPSAGGRQHADSLAEDIILANVFSALRTAPSRRYAGSTDAAESEAPGMGMAPPAFSPELVGTAVSDQPGATRALLKLDPADPTPRLYAVGEGAGGFRVVSIEARSVQLTGPRGRLVLRLPQDREDPS
jgi:hypothetical protein